MRVAYVLGTSAGGTGRHVRMLADGLARRGVTVTVYGPAATWTAVGGAVSPGSGDAVVSSAPVVSGDGEVSGSGDSGVTGGTPGFVPAEITERPRPAHDLITVARLRHQLAVFRPDVVHAHGVRAGALAALAIGGRGRRGGRRRGRLIVTVHNAAPSGGLAGAVYLTLERLIARRADQVLCVSSDLAARMRGLGAREVGRALVPAPPAPPAPAAADTTRLRAEMGAGPDGGVPVVLTVARLAPQKGLDTLIRAAARWRRDRDPAPVLAIVGEGPLADGLARQAAAAGAPVRFLGRRSDVPALMAAADVFVLSSVWEGQPLVVQEALAAGLPVVATRVGGVPDLTGEDGALLVPPGDTAALAGAVTSVLDDPALAARLGEAAAKRAALLPTEDAAIDAALAACQRLAAAPR